MRGRDKLLEKVDGLPLLARQVAMARSVSQRVLVTLPPASQRRSVAADVEVVEVPDASEGMAASLRTGIALLTDAPGVMVLLPDLPELERGDLAAMMAAFRQAPDHILRASSGVIPGHPVIFPKDLLADFAALQGDTGAQPIIRAHAARLRLFPLPGDRATLDLDTPEAWEAWRARR